MVADDPELFENVRRILLRDNGCLAVGDTVHCDGKAAPFTNFYRIEMPPADWDGWKSEGGAHGAAPDPRVGSTLLFECRSAAWIAEVGKLLAEGFSASVWLVDSADVAWPAARVDPERVVLD